MDRRQFLKWGGFVTTTALTTGLTGCFDEQVTDPAAPSAASGSGWKFPQSIASADPKADSIVLWTRVIPATLADTATPNQNISIRLLVTDNDNDSKLGSNTALEGTLLLDKSIPALATFDGSVRHKLTGLSAGKTYYYQFVAGEVRSNVGRFKTAPASNTEVAQLKFAFLSCQDWSINHWGGYDYLAKNEQLDFFLHLGDYIYETVGEAFQTGAVESLHTALSLPNGEYKSGTSGAKYASTLADYRYLYKQYRSDKRLQAVHERFAMIAVWDDHEFSDDCWQDAETYSNGSYSSSGGDNNHKTDRRRNANRAWYEFMPADISYDESVSGAQTIKIYRDFQFGNLAHLIMTDERLYRSDHIIPEAAPNPSTGQELGSIGSRYMVPADTLASIEQRKIAGTALLGTEPLSMATILGATQREWWKARMSSASATWKLWGNEVSLLRMGLSGTDAIATLLALGSISSLAGKIGTTAAATGGNMNIAGAVVAAVTAGASQTVGVNAATAIAAADASAGGNLSLTDGINAAVGAGATTKQAGLATKVYQAAKAASAAGAPAQAAAGAQVIAFGHIKPDIQENKQNSPFVIAAGKQATLAPYFTKFLLNADQWDGYNAERKDLMKHLKNNNIKNVVALTGDIHAFFAGTVNDDYDAGSGGTPVMVDLVSAGASSDSFFSYLRDTVGSVSADLATLIYREIPIPGTPVGTVTLKFNLLDYTLGRAAPNLDALAQQARVQLRGALAQKGVPEAQLNGMTDAILTALKASSEFNTSLLGLAQQLAALNSNPWLKYVNTDAQGYSVVTVTPTQLSCTFKQVNKLVGSSAPSSATVIAGTTTATVTSGTAAVTIG